MSAKNIKVLNANITIKGLFKQWLQITHAYHNMTKQQINILALLLYYHWKLSKEITNTKILWKVVFDYDTKTKIKEELGIADAGLQNVLTKFREKDIIKNNKIASVYIPQIGDNNNFKIIFNFNIVDGNKHRG